MDTVMMKKCETFEQAFTEIMNKVMPMMSAYHSDIIYDYDTMKAAIDCGDPHFRIAVRDSGTHYYNSQDDCVDIVEHQRSMGVDPIAVVALDQNIDGTWELEVHVK